MVKKKRYIAFWSNIKFKYKLTIINENTLEEMVGIPLFEHFFVELGEI